MTVCAGASATSPYLRSIPITVASAALCLLLAHTAFAEVPLVLSASISKVTNQIVITGQSLQPTSGSPKVTLDGVPLVVVSFNSANINADLRHQILHGY